MNHILLECRHPTRNLIWKNAKRLWPHGDDTWPSLIGTTLGCGTLTVKAPNPQQNHECRHNKGATRLLRILISNIPDMDLGIAKMREVNQRDTQIP
jgi:hypothetical protein